MLAPYITTIETRSEINDTADVLRSDIQDIRYKANNLVIYVDDTDSIASQDTTAIIVLTENYKEGTFIYDPNSNLTAYNGVVFNSHLGSGQWVRNYHGAVKPEWWGAVGDGVTECHEAFELMFDYLEKVSNSTTYIELLPDSTYIIEDQVQSVFNSNFVFKGNNATIKRADQVLDSLKVSASDGDNYIIVNNPSQWTANNRVVVLRTDTSFNSIDHSANNVISSISGDTLFLGNFLSGLPSAIGTYEVNAYVIKWYDLLNFSQDNEEFNHKVIMNELNFDGNKSNNVTPKSWYMGYTLKCRQYLELNNCQFENIPNENISCTQIGMYNCDFENMNGSASHFSLPGTYTEQGQRFSRFVGNRVKNVNIYDLDHNEGVFTWSNAVGNVYVAENYIDGSGTGFLGNIGNDDYGDLIVQNNVVRNCQSIQTINQTSNSVKYIYKNNNFHKCGELEFDGNGSDSVWLTLDGNVFNDSCSFYIREANTQITNNEFINLSGDNLFFLLNYSTFIEGNLFYNSNIEFNTSRSHVNIVNNRFLNDSTHTLNNSFAYIRASSSNLAGTFILDNNYFHENNYDHDTDRFVYIEGNWSHIKISNNSFLNGEEPVAVVEGVNDDTLRETHVINNQFYIRVRNRNRGGGAASFNINMIVDKNHHWSNNYFLVDSVGDRVFSFDRSSFHKSFINNQVYFIGNPLGADITPTSTLIFDDLGIIRNNIYNGLERFPDTINITDPTTYTISDGNLNVDISPNIKLPTYFRQRD
jgi:hypothetical protein